MGHLPVISGFWGKFNVVKCNLKELTTKNAWVPRSAVFSKRMLGGWLHRSCDSLARSVFPSCWVLPAIFFPSRPSPRPVGFFLYWCFCQCDGCLFLSFGVGAHGWVALLCQSWGSLFQSRRWLPVVEAPGYLRHPTSFLAMQLLTRVRPWEQSSI